MSKYGVLKDRPKCKCGAVVGLFVDGEHGYRCPTCVMTERDRLIDLVVRARMWVERNSGSHAMLCNVNTNETSNPMCPQCNCEQPLAAKWIKDAEGIR